MNKKKKKLYYNNIMNHSIVVQELYQRLTRQSGSGPAEDKLFQEIINMKCGTFTNDDLLNFLEPTIKTL